MKSEDRIKAMACAVCMALAVSGLAAQTTLPPAAPPATGPAMVELNFPENLDLKVLVDYVGKRQGVNFLYDEQIGSKKVTIKAPQKVPASSLMALLESVLAMKGLAMVPMETPGMIRIEAARALSAVAAGPNALPGQGPEARTPLATTRVFELKHASPQQVDLVIKPFLAAPTASVALLPEHDMVIVTDYTGNMKRLADLIALVDRPRRDVQVRFVPVRHIEAATLAQKLTLLLAGKAKARGTGAKDEAADVTVLADERSNQVMVIGAAEPVTEAMGLLQSLDTPLGLETRTYATASAERVDRLVKDLIGDATAKRLYKSAVDRESNLLIVTATPEIHQQVETIRKTLDKPADDGQSPVRFYKLENANAVDVIATLQTIEGDSGLGDVSVDGVAAEPRTQAEKERVFTGPTEGQINGPDSRGGNGAEGRGRSKVTRVNAHGARIMADEASNMIIIVAKPAMQSVYEKLIKRLDVRRPQVLIEATVVAVDTTNNFSLGVEISKSHSVDGGKGKLLTFSSFGLSEVDKSSGALTLKPGVGFNGVLLGADIADVVVQALASDTRAKVISRPSMLINDNAKATLVSENEEPFASVNASTTVATTSFAGYSSAGTNIVIKPQISDGDHLKLQYEITLSSFGDARTDSLPPSRQKNMLTSEVAIPDGHTIVVGGLTRENAVKKVDRIPWLGDMPGMEYMVSNRSNLSRKTTLFVFIRAVILRDDKFKDLKVLSRDATARAEMPGDFPVSEPREIPWRGQGVMP